MIVVFDSKRGKRGRFYNTCIYFLTHSKHNFYTYFKFQFLYSNIIFVFYFFLFCFSFSLFACATEQITNMQTLDGVCVFENRSVSANARNGCARINATRATNDAYDATISVISLWTAVCDNGGPGNNHYNNCTTTSSSNSNCTYLRYLFSTSSTHTTSNH